LTLELKSISQEIPIASWSGRNLLRKFYRLKRLESGSVLMISNSEYLQYLNKSDFALYSKFFTFEEITTS
jgi:hypothetical protein